uniref:Uncharacterized protein n=1 Tax=Alexandrium monilatum TaxID=311494 RepID=A0A7S4WAY9_9DINO
MAQANLPEAFGVCLVGIMPQGQSCYDEGSAMAATLGREWPRRRLRLVTAPQVAVETAVVDTNAEAQAKPRKRCRRRKIVQTSDEEREEEVTAAVDSTVMKPLAGQSCQPPSPSRAVAKRLRRPEAHSGAAGPLPPFLAPGSQVRRRAAAVAIFESPGLGAAKLAADGALTGLAVSDAESSGDGPAPERAAADTQSSSETVHAVGRDLQGVADSDAESSAADSAVSTARTSKAFRATVGELGADNDPEVGEWERDLEGRRAPVEGEDPGTAFSKALCSASEIRRLPRASRLAGQPVFDAAGRVNLHLLLGAYCLLRAKPCQDTGSEVRHLGWLARRARDLGLVSSRDLKRGRASRRRCCADGAAAADPRPRHREPECVLAEERELRFPSRPGQRRCVAAEGDSLFSDVEDDVERFKRRKKAVMDLRSLNNNRQTRIGSFSSHNVNLRGVRDTVSAPSLSFDWNGFEEDSDEGQGGPSLEVDVPVNHLHRDSRRDLFKEEIHRSVSRILVQDLAPGENEQKEEEQEEEERKAGLEEEPSPAPATRRRRRRRTVAEDNGDAEEEDEEEAPALDGDDTPNVLQHEKLGPSPPPGDGPAEATGAGVDGGAGQASSVGVEVEEPRSFSRLRHASVPCAVEGLERTAASSDDEGGGGNAGITPRACETGERMVEEADAEDAAGSDCSWIAEERGGSVQTLRRQRLLDLKRRHRQAQRHARSLRFEVQDAEELAGDATARLLCLGTATMSEEDRLRWKTVVPGLRAGLSDGIEVGHGSNVAAPTRRLLGLRHEDECSHLYSFAGAGSRKISFMKAKADRDDACRTGA